MGIELIKNKAKFLYDKMTGIKCSVGCWNYVMFGGEGGCEALDSWGSIHEHIEPGRRCLHPEKKDNNYTNLGTVTNIGICSALEGIVVTNGECDNTNFANVLTGRD